MPAHAKSSDTSKPPNPEDVDIDTDALDENIRADYIYKADCDGIDALIARGDWSRACMKNLDLCCLHTCALNSLRPLAGHKPHPDVKEFILKAKFGWVRHTQDKIDTAYMSLSEILKRIAKRRTDDDEIVNLTEQEIAVVKQAIEERFPWRFKTGEEGDWYKEDLLKGNPHTESLHMAFADLQSEGYDKFVLPNDRIDEKDDVLQLPDRAIFVKFNDKIEIMPESKRCCLACHAFLLYMDKRYHTKILYPGDHTSWSATAIPPWAPKEAFKAISDATTERLKDRMSQLLEDEDIRIGKSPLSTGSHSGTTDRDEEEIIDEALYDLDRYGPIPTGKTPQVNDIGNFPGCAI